LLPRVRRPFSRSRWRCCHSCRSAADKAGRKVRQIDGGGQTTEYRYDRLGHVIETRKAATSVVKATYDVFGHKASETDQLISTTTYFHDYFGRLGRKVDIGGAIYDYRYDKALQLVSQINTRAQNLAYAYDAAGQLTTITDSALGQLSSYAYDFSGPSRLKSLPSKRRVMSARALVQAYEEEVTSLKAPSRHRTT